MAPLHPDVARTRLAVRDVLAGVGLAPGALVLVACSGGSDSLALAAATAFEARRAGLRAGAVVVDHGLQAGSHDHAERVAQQCRDLGLDPVTVRAVLVGPGGVEAAARTARHAALRAQADDDAASLVLLGHTQDDQAETVLLRLARGSGSRSLAGIPPERGLLRRPFLGLRRSCLRAACGAQGLTWWDDPGNDVDGPLRRADGESLPRAAVRHRVLPALGAALGSDPVPALARTADQLRADADLLEHLAAVELERVRVSGTGETAGATTEASGLDAAALAATHPALLPRVLRAWLLEQGAPAGDLGSRHLDAVAALVRAWHGQLGVDVPGGRVVREGGVLRLG